MTVPLHYLLKPVKTVRVKKLYRPIYKILGLFVNPLTADDKYCLLNRGNLLTLFQMQLSQKRKIFSEFFFTFSKFRFNLEYFRKKRWHSRLMYFRTYGLRNRWLDKGLKSLISEDSLRSNKVNGTKHCWNLNDNTFTIFIDPC